VGRLWDAARSGRLPHALLFEGRAGIGKFLAARYLAAGMLCARGPADPCGACGPCRRLASGGERGNHPDLLLIDEDLAGEEQIRIARITPRPEDPNYVPELCLEVFLALHPMEGKLRVVIVREAQRMNAAAQSALLKTLEEPRSGTLLVLETDRTAALLPTILSRCVRIRFDPLSRAQCEQVLRAEGVPEEAARRLARIAEGSPGRAQELARNGTLAVLEGISAAARGLRPALEVAAELWEIEGEFTGRTEGMRARERARAILDAVLALARDAWRLAAGAREDDLALGPLARPVAERSTAHELARRGRFLAAARADVERNLQPTHLVERALLVLAEGVLPAAAGVRSGTSPGFVAGREVR
jgi:DNA polymerase-3 subunit delta'